jgi:hypothetical protein
MMSHQKLLKAPARLLLITFVMTSNAVVPINAAAPRTCISTAHVNRPATATAKARARQDLYPDQGIERWGLNE